MSDEESPSPDAIAEPPDPAQAAPARRSRPLSEDDLDDLAGRIAAWPEPVAALGVVVEVARAEGDATGVRKRLFELGIGVVRYAVSAGLAVLAARLGAATAPKPLADALRRAARLSDGQWCDLARAVAGSLRNADAAVAKALAFTSQKPLAELVSARNDFIHRGGPGDDALDAVRVVRPAAAPRRARPGRGGAAPTPASCAARAGTPVRAGVWRKTQGLVPTGVEQGAAYLALGPADWVRLDPFLPLVDRRLLVLDPPHAAGKSWRWLDPDTGEHREHAPLDEAMRRLAGEDPSAPRELTDRPALVGRAAALKAMIRAAEEARDGGVRVVLLTGAFGIGRSRLAQAASESAAGFGFGRVIEVACSAERRGPLRALRRAVEEIAGLERVREAIAGALSVDASGGRAGLDAFLEAIEEALAEASLIEPTVLIVDDAQWADEHTLAVLRLLTERATRKAKGKLFVVVASRDEPGASPALRRFIGQVEQDVGSGATRLALAPLASDDAARLVQGVAPMDPAVERTLVNGAGGVPFFVVQPLLVWNETGALEWRDGAWRPVRPDVLAVAPGVRDLVRARLGSYFDPGSEAERTAQHVLACVALFGTGLPIDFLSAATEAAGTGALGVEKALGALVECGLLVVRGDRQEHGFAQRIVQQAVLDDLRQKPWFRRVHRALLDAVAAGADPDADAAFLSVGYEALGARDEAAVWLGRAIERALATGAFEEAAELGERLAKAGRDAAERARGELSVVDALARSGRPAAGGARLAKSGVEDAGDPATQVRARILRLGLAAHLRDLPADHDPELVRDADASGDVRLGIEARLAAARLRRGVAGLALLDEAIGRLGAEGGSRPGSSTSMSTARLGAADALGRSGAELRYRALYLRFELLVQFPPGERGDHRRAAELARDAARELGSPWAELTAENALALAETNGGDLAHAIALFERLAASAKERRFGTLPRGGVVNRGACYVRSAAAAGAGGGGGRAGAPGGGAGDARLVAQARSIGADALTQLGRLEEARAAIDEAVAIALEGKDYTATLALLRRAEIRAKTGELAPALEDAAMAKAWAEAAGNTDHAVRADLWTALRRAEADPEEAARPLRAAVDAAAPLTSKLRAPTLKLLEDARKALAASAAS